MRSDFYMQSIFHAEITPKCRVIDGITGFTFYLKVIHPRVCGVGGDVSVLIHENPIVVSVIIQSVRQIIEVGAVLYLFFRFGYGFCCCRSTGSWWSFR